MDVESNDLPSALPRLIEMQLSDIEASINDDIFEAIASLAEEPVPEHEVLEKIQVDAARLKQLAETLAEMRYEIEEAEEQAEQ